MIELTEAARRECARQLGPAGPAPRGIRLGVRAGGCAGSKYVLDCGVAAQAGDHVFVQDGLEILCDPATLPLVDGLRIDYVEALMGGGFRFENPLAKSTCACGESFAV